MDTIYCDTCIYIDLYEWREGKWIHFGEEAKKLLDGVEGGELSLVVSDHLEYQLKGFPQYQEYVKKVKNLTEVKATKEDKKKASKEAENDEQTEYEDALHAELAIKGGADILVTRNIEHFAAYSSKIKIQFPEHVGVF